MSLLNSSVNGEISSRISIQDRGFNYGDGLFETIALVNHKLVFWEPHYQRLLSGCNVLGIKCPLETDLKNEIDKLIGGVATEKKLVVKIIVTRGESERGYKVNNESIANVVLLLSSYPEYSSEYWQKGVVVKLCETTLCSQKKLAGLKHLNRLEQVLARREWDDEFQEGLMSDDEGHIIEGVMSNVFIVKNHIVFTASISKAGVTGVMRNIVLNLCESNGIITKQDEITLEQVLDAEEVFLTNSLIGIWPVKKIDSQSFTVGSTTKELMQLLIKEYSIDYATLSI